MPQSVIEHIRGVVGVGVGPRDGELLGRFVDRRDEAALAALVNRHGPMVWGVCRRQLSHHDAEDAFQATFIVLVRKAASIAQREAVGNWLYGVAHQTALQARRSAARRRVREVQVTEMPNAEAPQEQRADLQPLLDQELSRLPDIYRSVIVLCELEGKTRKQASQETGVPEGTIGSRLTRAREMLARRLAQRGVVLSCGALATMLAKIAASATVPGSVLCTTISAANLFATGHALAGRVISAKAVALAEGVIKAMMISKLKIATAVILVLTLMTAGVVALSGRASATARAGQAPAVEAPVPAPQKTDKEKEPFTAWGKEAGGLQAGVGFRAGEKRAYRHGETVTFVVRVRNVSKEAVAFQYVPAFFNEHPPLVTGVDGKPFRLAGLNAPGRSHPPADVTLAPGKEVEIAEWRAALRPASDRDDKPNFEFLYGTGTFGIQYERVLANSSASRVQFDPAVSKLATGKLELEVKDPDKQPQKEEKESFTAWGKEVDGLQAGLAAESSTCRQGEKLNLTFKLRNVGKAEVTVNCGILSEWAPQVTTDTGGRVTVYTPPPFDGLGIPIKRALKPGETITLYNPAVAVESEALMRLKGIIRVDTPTISVAPGKYKIAFAGMIQSHPKLSTGTVEFEVKPASVTAWGKEFSGLQAGLGFRPGEKRPYTHGETVNLVVRVRNVSKEDVKFQYLKEFFMEKPPTVTGGEGKTIRSAGVNLFGRLAHVPVDVNLAPGKEMELHDVKIKLAPAGGSGDVTEVSPETLNGKGKFQIQYEQLAAASIDPILSKLATGKLELEIKSAEKK